MKSQRSGRNATYEMSSTLVSYLSGIGHPSLSIAGETLNTERSEAAMKIMVSLLNCIPGHFLRAIKLGWYTCRTAGCHLPSTIAESRLIRLEQSGSFSIVEIPLRPELHGIVELVRVM